MDGMTVTLPPFLEMILEDKYGPVPLVHVPEKAGGVSCEEEVLPDNPLSDDEGEEKLVFHVSSRGICIHDRTFTRKKSKTILPSTTIIATLWNDIPHDMQNAFGPKLKASHRGGYNNVQVKRNGTFQAQLWDRLHNRHTQLATVSDPKVGALLIAAASVDPFVARETLSARGWFLEMVNDPQVRSEWLRKFTIGET